MPIVFRFGRYVIYFWSDESQPLEPVHVHVSLGHETPNATKLWITSSGEVIVCNNNSRIPDQILRKIVRAVEHSIADIVEAWYNHFGEVSYIR